MSALRSRGIGLEEKVESTKVHAKAHFMVSALVGFGVGVIDRIATNSYNPVAAATATAVIATPFLMWNGGAEKVGRYLAVNAGLNAGYGAGYAAAEAIKTLFSN